LYKNWPKIKHQQQVANNFFSKNCQNFIKKKEKKKKKKEFILKVGGFHK
jgi:hypothetical protein